MVFLLLGLLADVLFLLLLAPGFELALVLERVELLLHFGGGARLVRVEHHVAAAEALLNFDEAQLEAGAELVKPDRHLRVLLLVLVVVRQRDLASWQVVNLALRAVRAEAVCSRRRPGRLLLTLVPEDEVLNAIVLR